MTPGLKRLIDRIQACEGYGLNRTDIDTVCRDLKANEAMLEALKDAQAKLHNILYSHAKDIGTLFTGTTDCEAKARAAKARGE